MNNRVLKSLLVAALVISAQSVSATDTNKTFMAVRPVVSLPMINTTWQERTNAKIGDLFGGHILATGFYGQSTKASDLGKYFGVNSKDSMTAGVVGSDIDFSRMVAANVLVPGAHVTTVKFAPKSVSYGADLAYYQDLSKVLNGLYLKINAPIVRVENDMKMTVGSDVPAVTTAVGTFLNTGVTYGKINGKQAATGVANVDAVLGYKFLNKEAYNMSINLGLTIPTGNDPKAVYVNEALYGSKHFGLGGGLDAQARIWGDMDHNIKLNFAANYRYLFQASEKRILGLNDGSANVNMSQYFSVGVVDAAAYTTGPAPAVNYLAKNVNVTPGSQLDGIIGLGYNKGGFGLDLGYNMFFKEAESVKKKDAWTDIIALRVVNTRVVAAPLIAFGAFDAASTRIAETMIKTANAETPSQFTHSVYGGMGYAFKTWEYPLTLGLGGKYEFASKNSAPSGWQAWGKVGLSF